MFREGGFCNTINSKKGDETTINQAKKDIQKAKDEINKILSDIQKKYTIDVEVNNNKGQNLNGGVYIKSSIHLRGFI